MCVCVFSGRQLALHRTKSCRGRWSSWRDATCTTTFVINYPLIDKNKCGFIAGSDESVSWFRAHADSVLDTILFAAAEGAVFFLSSVSFRGSVISESHQSDAVCSVVLAF